VFYQGLKDFARDAGAKKKIAEIINEEKRHVRVLKQSLELL
jgi:rubrerythrin